MKLKKTMSMELKCVVKKRIYHVVTDIKNKKLGGKLKIMSQLKLAPFTAINFMGWGDWEQDPLKNRSWQWRLNWLSFISYLIAYHHESKNEKVLSFTQESIQSWLDQYLKTDINYPFEFIWHDHATALRAEQLVLFIYYCREYAPEWAAQQSNFLAYVEQALIVHGEWLAKDSFYSEHTNHGLEQARVLLLLGTVFEGELAKEWQQIAIRRISSELDFSFTSEGVHVENSPAYHIFVFKLFMGIIKDYPEEILGNLAQKFNQFSEKSLDFITHILRPDAMLPPIGDTEQLPTSNAYSKEFDGTTEYLNFLYAQTQGKQGLKPFKLNRVYPKSGYAIFRDKWPNSDDYQQAFHIIVKVGCSSRYHHQQDEGHISVYGTGEDWLIDSGLYNYINKDPIRKYMRTRSAHNVPLISHASYDKEFEHRLSNWKVLEFSDDDISPYIDMELKVLVPITQIRRVQFNSGSKEIVIADIIKSSDKEERNITLQWHIPQDKKITILGNHVIVKSTSGNQMLIKMDGPEPDSISVAKGLKDDRVFSAISYKANHYEPSQVIRVFYKGYNELNVSTNFTFQV